MRRHHGRPSRVHLHPRDHGGKDCAERVGSAMGDAVAEWGCLCGCGVVDSCGACALWELGGWSLFLRVVAAGLWGVCTVSYAKLEKSNRWFLNGTVS